LIYDRANFQPDELIRRGISGSNRGQDEFYPAVQWIEQTVKFGYTNVLSLSIRNRGTLPDSFAFKGVTGITGGIKANYYLEPSGTDITSSATNAGWFSGVIGVGNLQEIRVQIVVNNTNLFNQDLVFTSTSVTDPTKLDVVRLRLLRDDDNDGLPDAWEQKYFGSSTNAVALADSDGDGLSNMQEYIAGTDPTSAAYQLLITKIEINPTPASLTLTWPSVTNRFYTVETAFGSPGVFVPLWGGRGSRTESSFTEPMTSNSPARFYRIRAEVP
jgi:hypothetical protein